MSENDLPTIIGNALAEGVNSFGEAARKAIIDKAVREWQAEQNRKSVLQQQNYATEMSNTAYQRSIIDMELAGLNKSLIFGSGGAASTPSSSALGVSLQNPSDFESGNPFSKALSTAKQYQEYKLENQKMSLEERRLKLQKEIAAIQNENVKAKTAHDQYNLKWAENMGLPVGANPDKIMAWLLAAKKKVSYTPSQDEDFETRKLNILRKSGLSESKIQKIIKSTKEN